MDRGRGNHQTRTHSPVSAHSAGPRWYLLHNLPPYEWELVHHAWAGSCLFYTTPMRSDRTPGNRAAYEAARQKILKTQTICGICGKPVDFSYRNPHPLSPTVDHIIPVSKGGHPSDISNLQLAHRCCNRQKSDSLIEPRKKEEGDSPVPNDLLEQHYDWINYRSS